VTLALLGHPGGLITSLSVQIPSGEV